MKKFVFLMFFMSASAMDIHDIINMGVVDQSISRPVNIKNLSDINNDEEELINIILCFQLKTLQNGVGVYVQNAIRKKIKDIRDSDEISSSTKLYELERFRPLLKNEKKFHLTKKKILRNQELYDYINSMVADAIEEYAHVKEAEIERHKQKSEEHERRIKVKERQKWAAIALSAISIIAGTTVSIIASCD